MGKEHTKCVKHNERDSRNHTMNTKQLFINHHKKISYRSPGFLFWFFYLRFFCPLLWLPQFDSNHIGLGRIVLFFFSFSFFRSCWYTFPHLSTFLVFIKKKKKGVERNIVHFTALKQEFPFFCVFYPAGRHHRKTTTISCKRIEWKTKRPQKEIGGKKKGLSKIGGKNWWVKMKYIRK